MSDTPKVEVKSEYQSQYGVWGKEGAYQSGEKLKLSSVSVFWILAPLFLLLPWVIYIRNGQIGKKASSTFSVTDSGAKEEISSLEIPEMSKSDPAPKPKIVETLKTYSALQVIGVSTRVIAAGSQVKAVLVTGASDGLIKAKTSESLIVENDVLLNSGVTLIGQGQSGDDRLFVVFKKLVWPDGTSKQVTAYEYDVSDMIAGLKGSKVQTHSLKFGTAAGLNFLGGLSEGLQETQVFNGVAVRNNSLRNAALNGMGKAALDQGKSILESVRNQGNVIEVKANTPIWVVFGGEN
ncbi:MAG: TrbI/VirB10 family protein [Bdellovibrionales bacterium]|nr:TrbI/VirB10 family protein [Bdellovibrionales bacterium]